MDRLYKAVHEKVNEGGKFQKALFNFAYEYKHFRYEGGYSTPIIDRWGTPNIDRWSTPINYSQVRHPNY